MCQQEAYNIIKKNKHKWMTIHEVLKQAKSSKGAISRALTKLSQHNEIKRRPQNRPALQKSAIMYEYRMLKKGETTKNLPAWAYKSTLIKQED